MLKKLFTLAVFPLVLVDSLVRPYVPETEEESLDLLAHELGCHREDLDSVAEMVDLILLVASGRTK